MANFASPLVDLSPVEKQSFKGGSYQVQPVSGPLTLFRLLGRTPEGQWNTAFGQKCWFEERLFFDCVCDARGEDAGSPEALASLRFLLRDRLAVRANWNDFHSFVALRLPKTFTLDAAVGQAEAQSYMTSLRAPGRQLGPLTLAGGARQYIINVQRQLTPLLVGPQPISLSRA